MEARKAIMQITPPFLVTFARGLRRRLRGEQLAGFFGDYSTWAEASDASTGYDSELILEKTTAALLMIRNGEAAYERDAVLFDEIEYSWPLAAGLLRAAALGPGGLDVLDYGGSLGSTYFQNRSLLRGVEPLHWSIIEQPAHVEIGRREFATEELSFYPDLDAYRVEHTPTVIVLGSVLQYLPEPHAIFARLAALPCDHIVIDRTPFTDGEADRICVQQLEPYIYDATYPAWLLGLDGFLARVSALGFEVVAQFPAIDTHDNGPVAVTFRGMLLERTR